MILRGRGLNPGRAEGEAMVSRAPLSFLGGVDPATGAVRDPATGLEGRSMAGKVLVFPQGKGSTVGSYVLYAAVRHGVGPRAIVCERAETIVTAGAVLAGIPLVDRLDAFAIEDGDGVSVDGGTGEVGLEGVREEPVASAFLRRGDRFLLLRRGPTAPTHPDLWSGVSGLVEGGEAPAERAAKEIEEETGLAPTLAARGDPVYVRLGPRAFRIHPFLFDCPEGEPRLNYENTEARWVRLEELDRLPAVPRLRDALQGALHGSPLGHTGPPQRGARRRA